MAHAEGLSDIRVVDMSTLVAGPSAARHLADFGALVVKAERPGGDDLRRMGWKITPDDDSLYWKLHSRNKRSEVVDLSSEAGRSRLRALLRDSDVLVENMRPGKLEAIGLAPESLWAQNPGLVILRVTGFGQDGPYASRAGFATLAEAMSGFAAVNGEEGGPPLLPALALTDELAGMIGAFGVMVALWARRHTGRGQIVDVSLLESILQVMGPLPAARALLDYEQPRLGSAIPYSVPRGIYQCADGEYVAISASAQSVALRILDILGLAGDARFADHDSRVLHRAELDRLLGDWIKARSRSEVIETLLAAEAAVAPVYSMGDVISDPHVRAREALIEVDGILMQGPAARLSHTPGRIRHAGGRYPDGTERP
jgi:crotonobetainyl-CoA:carnitine CoA-transferase CaiB-like acyl-CoA transferase